jgi:hypothetical protein
MAVLFLPLIAWGGSTQMTELNRFYANEEINAKAGMNLRYIVLFYLAIATSAVLVVIGVLQGWRRRRSRVYSR